MRPNIALANATKRLIDAGLVSPAVDARLLLLYVTNETSAGLLLRKELTEDELARYDQLIEQRAQFVPVQHLTGKAYFRHIELAVGPGVFIPRPETELMAGFVIDLVKDEAEPIVVDLCAGAGPIAGSICDEVSQAQVYAVEKSPAAFEYLRRNLVWPNAHPILADMDQELTELAGRVSVVVSNPPYVPSRISAELPLDVAKHDPAMALYGGEDGLAPFPVLARAARRLLRPGGRVVSEHGEEQAEAVMRCFSEAGFANPVSHLDLTGRPRFVSAELIEE